MKYSVHVEYLSLLSFVFILFKLIRISRSQLRSIAVYYVDGTPLAIRVFALICRAKNWDLSKLSFNSIDIREDESNAMICLSIPFHHMWKVKKSIFQMYPDWLPNKDRETAFQMFLKRSIGSRGLHVPGSLFRTMYLAHVAKQSIDKRNEEKCSLILSSQPWGKAAQIYGKDLGIDIQYINQWCSANRPNPISKFPFATQILEYILTRSKMYLPEGYYWIRQIKRVVSGKWANQSNRLPKIAVFGTGHHHFESDGFNSDIFFSLQSSLPRESLILLLLNDLSNEQYRHIERNGLDLCFMNTIPSSGVPASFYMGTPKIPRVEPLVLSDLPSLEKQRLRQLSAEFQYHKAYWAGFFQKFNIKVFTTWNKYPAIHIAIAEAMKEVGGIMTIWQRSYEELPHVGTSVCADVVFGYSSKFAELHKAQESLIGYHIATGYLQDYSQKPLKPKSVKLRKQLLKQGCTKMVSVFDENSHADHRWFLGHELQRNHYHFWSKKVLENKWLGVIFKPKAPKTLESRLGETASLLKQAEKTGRCLVLRSSGEHFSNTPVIMAAMASDVAVQGHLFAGTAGMESALCGIPTLLADFEGWGRSHFYQLGLGKTVFTDYDSMWDVLLDHWNSNGGLPGLGDWSQILDDLDPFRDGKAAERMGSYLHWLFEGLKQGLNRDTVLADAAERYGRKWGYDKIVS